MGLRLLTRSVRWLFITLLLAFYHDLAAMSLSMLVGGADCGPSNPLQGLSKQFDRDRGLQQVRLSTASSSESLA